MAAPRATAGKPRLRRCPDDAAEAWLTRPTCEDQGQLTARPYACGESPPRRRARLRHSFRTYAAACPNRAATATCLRSARVRPAGSEGRHCVRSPRARGEVTPRRRRSAASPRLGRELRDGRPSSENVSEGVPSASALRASARPRRSLGGGGDDRLARRSACPPPSGKRGQQSDAADQRHRARLRDRVDEFVFRLTINESAK